MCNGCNGPIFYGNYISKEEAKKLYPDKQMEESKNKLKIMIHDPQPFDPFYFYIQEIEVKEDENVERD